MKTISAETGKSILNNLRSNSINLSHIANNNTPRNQGGSSDRFMKLKTGTDVNTEVFTINSSQKIPKA